MIDFTKVQQIVRAEFTKLQESGYLTSENEDLEVAMAVESTSYNIASNVFDEMDAEYVLVDGNLYNKKAILALKPEER